MVLIAVSAAGIGFGIGRATAASAQSRPVPAAAPSAARPPAVVTRAVSGLVCAPLAGAPSDGDEPSCAAQALRARWCEGQLQECTAQRQAVRQAWPQDGIEQPEVWTDAVEEALAECEIGAELEVIDCTEYPCVAGLRPAEPGLGEQEREQEMKRLMEAARACAPLRRSLGLVATEEDDASIDVFRNDARCPQEREEFFVLTALDPAGPARALIDKEHRSPREERDMFRWLFRRADDVSSLWPCRSPADAR